MLAGFARKLPKIFELKSIGVGLSFGRYRIVFAVLNRTPAGASPLRGLGMKSPMGLWGNAPTYNDLTWRSEERHV